MAHPSKSVGVLITAFLIGLGLGDQSCLGTPLALQSQTIPQQATSKEAGMQLLNQGMVQMETRRFSDALRSLREALSRFQGNGNWLQAAHALNALSELYATWVFGDKDLALQTSQQALTLARQENDPSLEATALGRIARAQNHLGAYPKAIESAQASLKILKVHPNAETEGRALLSLSYAYDQLNDKDKALAYAQQAISLAQKSKDRKREVVALAGWGQRYFSKSQDYVKAMEAYQQALKIASIARDINGQLDILGGIYSAYGALKEYDKSISYRTQTLELARQIGDRTTEAFTLQDLGNAYQASGQPVLAVEAYQQSLVVAQNSKDVQLEAAVLASMGSFYQGRRDYKQTFGYYQQSLRLYQQLHLRPRVLSTLQAIAGIHYSLNDYPKAIATYEEALVIARELKKRASEGSILTDIGNAHFSQRQYPPSIAFYSRALPIYEELQWPTEQSKLLINIGNAYGELKNYQAKAAYYQRAIAVDRAMRNVDYEIVDLINLASVYAKNLNDRSKAVAYYQQALSIARGRGDRNLERTTLMSLGSAYSSQLQDIPQGISYHKQALAIARDQNRPDLASSLAEMAMHYLLLGASEQAMIWARESLVLAEISKDLFAKGLALQVVGSVEMGRGDVQQAIRLFQQALPVVRSIQNRSLEAGLLTQLGTAYSLGQGNQKQAVELLKQALALARQLRDLNQEAMILAAIGNNYQLLNDYAQAIYYAQQGLAISRQTGSEQSELISLIPLSISVQALGDDTKASAYGQRMLELSRRLGNRMAEGLALAFLGADPLRRKEVNLSTNLPQQVAQALGDSPVMKIISRSLRANAYAQQGAYLKAIALAQENVSSAKSLKLPIFVAESLHRLGLYYSASGKYQAAITVYREALAANPAPDVPGSNYETFAELAKTYRRLKQPALAIPYYKRAVDSEVLYLQSQLPLLPETGRQPLIETFGNRREAVFSLAGSSAEGTFLALFTRLNRHGLLQDIERRQALLSRAPGPQQQQAQQLAALTSRLADASLAEPRRKDLRQQRDQLEQELYRQLPAFQPRLVEPKEVARVLPADGVLVEFQRFRPYDANQREEKFWGDARYLALLLRPDGAITTVDLGAAAAIDKLIEAALTATQKELPSAQEAWSAVAQRIHTPLQPHLADRRQWFISPDGALHRVPFEALRLSAAAGKQPAQAVQLHLLTSGRDLLKGPSNSGTGGQSLVLADPETVGDWPRLPATGKEGRQVARDLGATLLEGKQASVSALQQARGPRVLHVASFGSFSAAPASGDPLLASVIVLAGADRRAMPNQKPTMRPAATTSAQDDGYLTAREAAQLQLDGTQLVVLSACDTGVGKVQNGEGIYGMQRALTVAGARSTLLSLWKVDDEATAWFMRRYYEQIKGGRGRMDALQDVQKEFRTRPKLPGWSHPIYWAAWQLTGDGSMLSK